MANTRLLRLVFIGIAMLAAQTALALDLQGHRGARGLMPENSIPAFKEALRLQVSTLELDVQVTRDRVLVVHHDARLNPNLCVRDDGTKIERVAIAELSHDELTDIDCGRVANPRFPGQRTIPGTRIPSLDEVLVLAGGAGYPVRFSIEMKWPKRRDDFTVEEFAQRLVALIKKYNLQRRTIVQSFHRPALVAVQTIAPEVQRAILVRQPEEYERAIMDSRATILSPRYDGLRRVDVERFQRDGVSVIPWTVNKSSDMCRLIAWGVDGLITDYPDRALELLHGNRCSASR